jgi:hypothetical protein
LQGSASILCHLPASSSLLWFCFLFVFPCLLAFLHASLIRGPRELVCDTTSHCSAQCWSSNPLAPCVFTFFVLYSCKGLFLLADAGLYCT